MKHRTPGRISRNAAAPVEVVPQCSPLTIREQQTFIILFVDTFPKAERDALGSLFYAVDNNDPRGK